MAGDSTSTVLSLFNSALSLFYPESCGACGAIGEILCKDCIARFRVIADNEVCPICGRWIGQSIKCGSCSAEKMWFTRGIFGFDYEGAVREAIHAFKFEGYKKIGRILARLISEKFKGLDTTVDCIIPMPVSAMRLRERGFNQSYIIAYEISLMTGITLCHDTLTKLEGFQDQYRLSRNERRRNIKGAFKIKDNTCIEKKRVLLVDDLFTTGYTASEAAKTLLKTGSSDVSFFALARVPS